MTNSNIAFTAPHWAATEAGIDILKEGGTATEAMVAAAAVISVVYPHMNSIGGDGFWLIDNPGQKTPMAIDACGRATGNLAAYSDMSQMPERGGLSALTQAGTIRGWQQALQLDQQGKLPLSRILAPAIHWAKSGFEISHSLQLGCEKLATVAQTNQAFKDLYLPNNQALQAGNHFKNNKLGDTFGYLAQHGLQAFYQGELAHSFVNDLSAAGSPLGIDDLANTEVAAVNALHARLQGVDCYNLPAPTQGVHSLQIIAIVEQLKQQATSPADWVHVIVEATKQSFAQRPHLWGDPNSVTKEYQEALTTATIKQLASKVSMQHAQPWPFDSQPGDTVWMAARDERGQMVSFIQSIYWEFGSGIAMSEGGFVWNNRGLSFDLNPTTINALGAHKKPAHTLNPALAKYDDGRRLAYGTMGGEGQPQTQAAVFSGYTWQNKSIAQAIADPRWLLGRTWGDNSNNLKVEQGLAEDIGQQLTDRQHDWQMVANENEMMGHAGAILDHDNCLEAATDPRSDGKAIVTKSINH